MNGGVSPVTRKDSLMPTRYTRHRAASPLDRCHALNRAAAEDGRPTTASITVRLLRLLEDRYPDLHVRDTCRNGVVGYGRRPRRVDELPDDVPLAALSPRCRTMATTSMLLTLAGPCNSHHRNLASSRRRYTARD